MTIKETMERTREPAAWSLLIVVFMAIVSGVATLLIPGEGSFGDATPFSERAFNASFRFLDPLAAAAPGVAVVLAVSVGQALARARVVAILALVCAGLDAVLGLVTVFVSLFADVPARFTVPAALMSLAGLALLAVAIMVAAAALGAEELKPAPKPQAYPAYGYGPVDQQYVYGYGQAAQPGQQWYGQQYPYYQQGQQYPHYQQPGQAYQYPYQQQNQPYGQDQPAGASQQAGQAYAGGPRQEQYQSSEAVPGVPQAGSEQPVERPTQQLPAQPGQSHPYDQHPAESQAQRPADDPLGDSEGTPSGTPSPNNRGHRPGW